MASNQYFEEPVPQVDSFEEKSSSNMLKCACDDAIEDSDRNGLSGFDCNICLHLVQDPVVTLCGHLYCWPCIYKWLNFHSISSDHKVKKQPQCPVCKSEISESSLVPLYGRDQTTLPFKSKAQQVGIVTPPRPLGPSWAVELLRSSQPTSQSFHPHPQQLNSILEDPLTGLRVEAELSRANTSLYNDVIIVRLRAAEAEASRLRETLALSHQMAETACQRAEAAVHDAQAAIHEAQAATQMAEAATEKAEAATEKAEAATRKAEATTQRAEAATLKAEAIIANQKSAVVETNARVDGMVATRSSTGTSQVPQQVYHGFVVDQDDQPVDDQSLRPIQRRRYN